MTSVTKTATVTTVGLQHMAKIVADESDSAITTLGVGTGTTSPSSSDTTLESETTGNGFAKTLGTCSFVSPSTLKIINRFTASGSDVTVREIGVFSADGILIARCTLAINDLPNDCIIPVGEDLEITAELTFNYKESPVTQFNPAWVFLDIINVGCQITADTDPGEYTCDSKVCFNGIPLRNPSQPQISEIRGRKRWVFECYTEDYGDIDDISSYASPVESGVTVTGHQWASSVLCSGTLRIYNKTTRDLDNYPNCYVLSPIDVSPFGEGWFYTVTILESYEAI